MAAIRFIHTCISLTVLPIVIMLGIIAMTLELIAQTIFDTTVWAERLRGYLPRHH